MARATPGADLPALIAHTLKDHGLEDATFRKGVEQGSVLIAAPTPAGAGSIGAARTRLPVRDVLGGTIGLANSLLAPDGVKLSTHTQRFSSLDVSPM